MAACVNIISYTPRNVINPSKCGRNNEETCGEIEISQIAFGFLGFGGEGGNRGDEFDRIIVPSSRNRVCV